MRYLLPLLLGLGCVDKGGIDSGDGDTPDDTSDPALTGCPSGEIVIPEGESFLCADGCNTCSCDLSGGVAGIITTDMYCYDPPPPSGCVSEHVVVDYGSSYPSIDGCNTCTCEESGAFSCTEMVCP